VALKELIYLFFGIPPMKVVEGASGGLRQPSHLVRSCCIFVAKVADERPGGAEDVSKGRFRKNRRQKKPFVAQHFHVPGPPRSGSPVLFLDLCFTLPSGRLVR
jgi:hypothetical protein